MHSVKIPLSLCAVSLIALCLCAAPVLAAPPAAPGRAAMQAGITAACSGIGDAFSRHDLPRIMSYFAPGYTAVDEKGSRFTREQTRQDYATQLGRIKTIHSRYVLQSLTPTAAGALVEMRIHSDGIGEKRVLFARLQGTFTDDLWVRDLWVDTPQGWRLQHRQTLRHDLRIHPR